MQNFSKLAAGRTSLCLMLGAMLVVAGWRLCIIANQRHLLAVASEVGSVPQFRERMFASGDGSSPGLLPRNGEGPRHLFLRGLQRQTQVAV